MKGILLAGGSGTRLDPLTRVINKHLLPVGNVPMIYHPIKQFENCNIKEVMIITGTDHAGTIIQQLGSGSQFGMEFTYRVQEKPLGIAHALSLAEDFAGNEHIMVMLGDNIFGENLGKAKERWQTSNKEACVFLKEVPDPERFGVAQVYGNDIISIEEKPSNPQSDLAVTGCYMYTSTVWTKLKTLMGMPPSARGEYEISALNNMFIEDRSMGHHELTLWWSDAGTPKSLLKANKLLSGSLTSES